jgi:hypothetical protein
MYRLIEESLDELKTRTGEYLKYEKIMDFNKGFFVVWFLIPLAIGATIKVLSSAEIVFLIVLGIVFAAASMKLPELKLKDYLVEDDEWARLYSYGIYNNLVEYFNTQSPGIKNKAKQKALTNAKSFLYVAEQRWNVGNFKLVRNYKKAISEFRKNLRYRVVPALKSDNNDLLRRVSRFMYNLFYSSKFLTIENIETFNKQITDIEDTKLPSSESQKIDYHRVVGIIKNKRLLPYVLPLATSAIPSIILGLVLMSYTDVGLSTTLIVTVTLFAALLAFFGLVRRGQ